MPVTTPKIRSIFLYALGVFSGVIFSFIIGPIDTADYLIEMWTLWLVEIPFIVFWAIFDKKFGWRLCFIFIAAGAALAYGLFLPLQSLTVVVFVKVGMMGIILGESSWFAGSFTRRMTAVALPGILMALVFGIPVILRGVPPDVTDRFREESLEMYRAFMSGDEATNAANNAIQLFEGIFRTGFAVLVTGSVIYTWISFLAARLLMSKFGEEPEEVAPFHSYRLPFHAVWVFLFSFGLLLIEYKPVFPVALNLLVIMAFLYLVQGLAIIMFQMNRFSLGRIPRVLFWLLFFFTIVFSGIFLIVIGLIDNWFNLRPVPSHNSLNENNEVYRQ